MLSFSYDKVIFNHLFALISQYRPQKHHFPNYQSIRKIIPRQLQVKLLQLFLYGYNQFQKKLQQKNQRMQSTHMNLVLPSSKSRKTFNDFSIEFSHKHKYTNLIKLKHVIQIKQQVIYVEKYQQNICYMIIHPIMRQLNLIQASYLENYFYISINLEYDNIEFWNQQYLPRLTILTEILKKMKEILIIYFSKEITQSKIIGNKDLNKSIKQCEIFEKNYLPSMVKIYEETAKKKKF